MSRRLAFAALLFLALARAAVADLPSLSFGRFGALQVSGSPTASDVVIVLAGDGHEAFGRVLAESGALVLALDPATYLAALRGSKEACGYPAGELEDLSHFAQQRLGRASYSVPLLVGAGDGAALAWAALAQAPPNTFRGALGVGFAPELPLARPLCRGHGLVSHEQPDGRRIALDPPPADADSFATLPAKASAEELVRAFTKLASRTRASAPALHADVSDLPLVELPAKGDAGGALAVILSGDGGWASLDREVGAELASRGIPVIGWNTLQYFWTARTPDESAAALVRVLRHYLGAWDRQRALLIGYSFGAEVLPFLVDRLPPDLRARVAVVALLGPGPTAEFEFHFGDWLGARARPEALPVAPEVEKLAGLRVLCVYGREERDSLCPKLPPDAALREERPGDHHFGGDYAPIAARIVSLM